MSESYIIYTGDVEIESNGDMGTVQIYSKNKYTKKEITSMIKKVLDAHRKDILVYDIFGLYEDELIDEELFESGFETVAELGEDIYPDIYLYVDTDRLLHFIEATYPDFSRENKSKRVEFGPIVLK